MADFRDKYSIDVRVALLEQEVDGLKQDLSEFRKEVRDTHVDIKAEMKSGSRVLQGILVFLVTTSLLALINVALLAGGVGPK